MKYHAIHVGDFMVKSLMPALVDDMLDKCFALNDDTPELRARIGDMTLAATMLIRRRGEERRISTTNADAAPAKETAAEAEPARDAPSPGYLRLVHSSD